MQQNVLGQQGVPAPHDGQPLQDVQRKSCRRLCCFAVGRHGQLQRTEGCFELKNYASLHSRNVARNGHARDLEWFQVAGSQNPDQIRAMEERGFPIWALNTRKYTLLFATTLRKSWLLDDAVACLRSCDPLACVSLNVVQNNASLDPVRDGVSAEKKTSNKTVVQLAARPFAICLCDFHLVEHDDDDDDCVSLAFSCAELAFHCNNRGPLKPLASAFRLVVRIGAGVTIYSQPIVTLSHAVQGAAYVPRNAHLSDPLMNVTTVALMARASA